MRVYVLFYKGGEPCDVFASLADAMLNAEANAGVDPNEDAQWMHGMDEAAKNHTWVLRDASGDERFGQVIEEMTVKARE